MINSIIFDLDNTLINRNLTFKNFITRQYFKYQSQLNGISEIQYTSLVLKYDNSGYGDKLENYKKLFQKFHISEISAKELFFDYKQNYGEKPVLIEGVLEALEVLKKDYKLAILSNGRTLGQNKKIDGTGIRKYFDTIVISEEEGIKKPDPEIFKRCLDRMNSKIENTVYIGDHPENDIVAPKKLGLKAIWIENSNFEKAENADGVFKDYKELPSLLKNLKQQ